MFRNAMKKIGLLTPAARRLASFCALTSAILAGTPTGATARAATKIIATESGSIVGMIDHETRSYKGIPYAGPPVGEWRWRAPRAAIAWTRLRTAGSFGPACVQPTSAMWPAEKQSEDCLTLNIWTPRNADARSKLPVMLWIHGGGSINGSGSDPRYDGAALAHRGVVVVTINYRLGRLGYFAHPALTAANADGGLLGNYALMDQLAAMRWVRRNIAGFGGNPANVVIFGQSSGGGNVEVWMSSPAAAGLFAKAITQSAPGYPKMEQLRGLDGGEGRGLRIAAALGVTGEGSSALSRLRSIPASAFTEPEAIKGTAWFIDGTIVREDISRAVELGHLNRVPWMIGSNSFDASFLTGFGLDMANPLAGYASLDREKIHLAYRSDDVADRISEGAHFLTDIWMGVTDRLFARLASAQQRDVFLYSFRYEPRADRGQVAGVPHSGEIPYVFASPDALSKMNAEDKAMASAVQDRWVSFAKNGRPRGWPAFRTANPFTEVFGRSGNIGPIADFRKKQLDLAAPYALATQRHWD